jgi:hypothetical protein
MLRWLPPSEYTSCTNVLDYPTVVVPVTFADESVDKMDPCFKPFSETDRINMEACLSANGLLR